MDRKSTGKPSNVLVVCHGNICRSPLVAAVLTQAIGAERVRSRGLKESPKGPAAKKVRDYAEGIGIVLAEHRASALTTADVEWADLLIYMDGGNRKRLEGFKIPSKCVVKCLGDYVGLTRIDDPNFLPRGPELDRLLETVVAAAGKLATELEK